MVGRHTARRRPIALAMLSTSKAMKWAVAYDVDGIAIVLTTRFQYSACCASWILSGRCWAHGFVSDHIVMRYETFLGINECYRGRER